MNWILKTLAAAVVAGVGWKLGVDTYEAVKQKLSEQAEKMNEEEQASDGAGATQTEVVDVSEEQQDPPKDG